MELPTYFESLIQRAPILASDITIFLREMRRTPNGPLITSKLLAGKIQSTSETNALRAFDFLEAALEAEVEGSIELRTEIGRYRFLNEIIRVLSPKYLGDQTSNPVKERAIKFLTDAAGVKRRRWFPSAHSKIEAVYGSLVESGIIQKVTDDPSAMDPDAEFKKSIFERGENAVLLKKLLQSKNPADLQAANRLIKNLVDEEAKRNERRSELHSLIDRIETSTSLMVEMLSQHRIDKEIVEELASTCQSLRNKLGGIGAETNEETSSLLQASENIEKALELYESKKNVLNAPIPEEEPEDQAEASGVTSDSVVTFSLADELLMGMDLGLPLEPARENEKLLTSTTDNLLNLDVELDCRLEQKSDQAAEKKETGGENLVFDEIGRMSRELMDKSLIGFDNVKVMQSTDMKRSDKRPMSQMVRNSESTSAVENNSIPQVTNSDYSFLDLDFLEKPESTKTKTSLSPISQNTSLSNRANSSSEDDNLLLVLEGNHIGPDTTATTINSNLNAVVENKPTQIITPITSDKNNSMNNGKQVPNFVLSTVRELDMEKIELVETLNPLKINVDDKGVIGLTLTFGSFPDFPNSVKVAVISVTNQSSTEWLVNYVFQLLPPKGVQVKLLPPSCTELPPWKKRFLPPPVLTQVALILVQSPPTSKLRYILSYCLEEETALHNGDFALPMY